eukprot:CAMPEP_0180711864 /NCGR_PEP_ID=MMETSP1038_2-20121128/11078_1 /TAXON_ID=632150 /ORGANISM="Azadinium spinosum, Strain 3D9" /LENGTH=187 /DNA_ID=CAMNT_0022744115 /DNA_START=485 /DNA_END=1048 /DNA_ORIENTATION=+
MAAHHPGATNEPNSMVGNIPHLPNIGVSPNGPYEHAVKYDIAKNSPKNMGPQIANAHPAGVKKRSTALPSSNVVLERPSKRPGTAIATVLSAHIPANANCQAVGEEMETPRTRSTMQRRTYGIVAVAQTLAASAGSGNKVNLSSVLSSCVDVAVAAAMRQPRESAFGTDASIAVALCCNPNTFVAPL